jgi:GTPase SAR1 family protein
VLLVGNKTDLPEQRQVSPAAAAEFAQAHGGLKTMETSAKTGERVADVFKHVALELVLQRRNA